MGYFVITTIQYMNHKWECEKEQQIKKVWFFENTLSFFQNIQKSEQWGYKDKLPTGKCEQY